MWWAHPTDFHENVCQIPKPEKPCFVCHFFFRVKMVVKPVRKETLFQLGIQLHKYFLLEQPYFNMQRCFMYASCSVTQNIKIYTQGINLPNLTILITSSGAFFSKIGFFFFFTSAWKWRIKWQLIQFGTTILWDSLDSCWDVVIYTPLLLYHQCIL